MPHVSRDFDGFGDLWVRYGGGWEQKKTIASPNCTLIPSFPVITKSTREKIGFNCLSEALFLLDFASALKDPRRFAYVSQVLLCLCKGTKIIHLSTNSRKIVFTLIEIMAGETCVSRQNEHVLKQILQQLQQTFSFHQISQSDQGSRNLLRHYRQHCLRIEQILSSTKSIQSDNASLTQILPEECVREVLLRLSDVRDIERLEKVCTLMKNLAGERRLWRELVQSHFTNAQIEFLRNGGDELRQDWRQLYWALRRRFGLKVNFVETILLCRKCSCFFWDTLGHRCIVIEESKEELEDRTSLRVPILPELFLSFFGI